MNNILKPKRSRLMLASIAGFAVIAAGVAGIQASLEPADPLPVVTISADYPQYDSSTALLDAADAVVTAIVIKTRTGLLYPDVDPTNGDPSTNPQAGTKLSQAELDAMAVPITISSVRVVESFDGSLKPGDIVEVKQLGGTTKHVVVRDSETTFISDAAADSSGGQVLLFLVKTDSETYSLANPTQGLMTVSDDIARPLRADGLKPFDLASLSDR